MKEMKIRCRISLNGATVIVPFNSILSFLKGKVYRNNSEVDGEKPTRRVVLRLSTILLKVLKEFTVTT